MGLLSFLTGVGSLFGSNGSKEKTVSNSSLEQAVSGTTQSTGTQSGTTTAQQSESQTGSTQSAQQTSTNQSTTGVSTGTQTGTTSNYSAAVLSDLDKLLRTSLNSGNVQDANVALGDRLAQVQSLAAQPAFDVNAYVSGITKAAAAASQGDVESRVNGMLSATGGSESGNSMAALLGNRIRSDAQASLAGTVASATAQGQQLQQAQQESLSSQILSLSGGVTGVLNDLLGAAKGGQTSSTAASTQTDNTVGTSTTNAKDNTTTTAKKDTTGKTTEEIKTSQTVDEAGVTQQNSTTATKKKKTDKDLFSSIASKIGAASAAA